MNNLIILTVLTFVGLAMVVYSHSSKQYWESIGPSWDQLLNPNKYSK